MSFRLSVEISWNEISSFIFLELYTHMEKNMKNIICWYWNLAGKTLMLKPTLQIFDINKISECTSYIQLTLRYLKHWLLKRLLKSSWIKAGVRNYQILLFVHGQSKWSKSTCPTKIIDIFFLFVKENICCGYSLEAPHWVASNEYPQYMFSSRNKKNIYLIIWILFLARNPGQVNWNFLLVLREMGQVEQVRHGISTALIKVNTGLISLYIS